MGIWILEALRNGPDADPVEAWAEPQLRLPWQLSRVKTLRAALLEGATAYPYEERTLPGPNQDPPD